MVADKNLHKFAILHVTFNFKWQRFICWRDR